MPTWCSLGGGELSAGVSVAADAMTTFVPAMIDAAPVALSRFTAVLASGGVALPMSSGTTFAPVYR